MCRQARNIQDGASRYGRGSLVMIGSHAQQEQDGRVELSRRL